jgi:hypothetical protein
MTEQKEVKRISYYDAGSGEYGKDVLKEPSYAQGIKAREQGILVQREIYQRIRREKESKGLKVIYSEDRGLPDMLVVDNDKVIEVIAVKAYSLMVTVGKGCRNVKGKKYAVSFNPKRDAKAEYLAALQNGLNKVRLIAINLRTGNTIFDGYVCFDETVTLRECSKNEKMKRINVHVKCRTLLVSVTPLILQTFLAPKSNALLFLVFHVL